MDISISDSSYKRLAGLAKGFEIPEQVINRLIDVFEYNQDKRPKLFFNPANENDFKQALMHSKKAKDGVTLQKEPLKKQELGLGRIDGIGI